MAAGAPGALDDIEEALRALHRLADVDGIALDALDAALRIRREDRPIKVRLFVIGKILQGQIDRLLIGEKGRRQ